MLCRIYILYSTALFSVKGRSLGLQSELLCIVIVSHDGLPQRIVQSMEDSSPKKRTFTTSRPLLARCHFAIIMPHAISSNLRSGTLHGQDVWRGTVLYESSKPWIVLHMCKQCISGLSLLSWEVPGDKTIWTQHIYIYFLACKTTHV